MMVILSCHSIVQASDTAKEMPWHFIDDFEQRYANSVSYELIETIEFDLSTENPFQTYKIKREGEGIIFSFVGTEHPIHVSMTTEDSQTYSGGFYGDTAISIDFENNTIQQFQYELGIEENEDINGNESTIDSLCGTLNVYKIIE